MTNVCILLVGLSSSSLVKMCLFQLLSGRLRHVTSTVTFSVQQRLKPSHHVMIYQLLPHFRAPRYRSIKMHDQSSSKKSEQYVVFYLQQVDARKHQESSSMSVLCTWHIRRGELEYLYQTRTKCHTCLSAARIISTNLSEVLWHFRPTDYATLLALRTKGRKTGQEAIKKSIGKVEGQGRQ